LIAIVDCNYLCYRCMFGMLGVDLSAGDMETEVIFGFCKQLLSLSSKFPITTWTFAWDSRKSFRKQIYPDYKGNRRKDVPPKIMEIMEVAFPQFRQVRSELLPMMGFHNNFIQTGVEADDIIAVICDTQKSPVVIISSDNDLHQLLTDKISMFNLKKLYTKKDFEKEHGIPPKKWGLVKAIAGCSTDNVKGVPGVGVVKAIKYINGDMPERYKAFKKIEESETIIERNRHLVVLPFETEYKITVKQETLKSFDFIQAFEFYNFRSFLRRKTFQQWETNFKLI